MKLPVDLIEKAAHEYRPSPRAIRDIRVRVAAESAVSLDGPEHVERRKRMIAAVAVEDIADAFERYIGNNDLLPINYLLLGHLQTVRWAASGTSTGARARKRWPRGFSCRRASS